MSQRSECVFCGIVSGREPASKIIEDDRIVAFMILRPVNPGECLIIPKDHVDHFCDLADEISCHIMKHAQRLSRVIRERFNPKRVGLIVHGFGVPHAHLILVPLEEPGDITSQKHVRVEDGKIRIGLDHIPPTPRVELDRVATILRDAYGERIDGKERVP